MDVFLAYVDPEETGILAIGFPALWCETRDFDRPKALLRKVVRAAFEILGWRGVEVVGEGFRVRVFVSLRSWGERVQVRIHDGQVTCESRCVYGVFDWGKNRENVEMFFAALGAALDASEGIVA